MAIDEHRRLGILIFVLSFSCLVFELSLLRIFSITLWYHFAFMVISIAMLGIAASGTALSVFPVLKDLRRVPLYALLFAASLPAAYCAANVIPFDPARLAWDSRQLFLIALYYLFLSVPFFLFGAVISTAFSLLHERSSSIYASDLLGAGTGSLAVLLLLSLGGPERAVFLASFAAAAAVLLTGRGLVSALAAGIALVDIALLAVQPAFIEPRMSPYKPLNIALSFPGAKLTGTWYRPYARVDTFLSPAARFAPGLSLTYREPLPPQTGIAVDGGAIEAVTDLRDPSSLTFLDHLPAGLPYVLARAGDVLVLDPGGGLAVLTARRYGATRIDAIESNPLLQRVVLATGGDAAAANGTRYHTGLGRSWLASSGRTYDIIDIPLSGAMPASAFGFAEDFRFTLEAFTTYLEHLKPGGVLAVSHYIVPPPRTELRILATLAEAAERLGISDSASHLVAIRSWGTVTILFTRSPLDHRMIDLAKAFCRERRFDVVYYPGILPGESNRYVRMQSNAYSDAFISIIDRKTRGPFLDDYLFDVRPVKDGNPFARYFLRLENLGETFRVMGEKWQFFFEEGYLLPFLFLQVAVISLLLLIAPLVAMRHPSGDRQERRLSGWPWYFASLGLGYLFIEMALIQKMSLHLEHPSYAAGAVIASLLISSGAGSLTSRRIAALRRPRTLLVLAVLLLLHNAALDPLLSALDRVALLPRTAIVFALLLPPGFLMGIPFPLGMTVLGAVQPGRVPWAWAVNGCFSVFAPLLAVMLSLAAGYAVVAGLGAGMYIAGYLLSRRWDGMDREAGTPAGGH